MQYCFRLRFNLPDRLQLGQKTILSALQLIEPARFFDFTLPSD